MIWAHRTKYFTLTLSVLTIGIIFRFFNLTQIPPALHGDETGTGYNAYSLIKTGVDEYMKQFPLTFRNDFSPLIFYATLPWIWIMGFSELSTRLPTATIGIFMIPVTYLLVLKLFNNYKLALFSTLLLSLGSWQIRSSRMALEMIWALFFQITAITLYLYVKPKRSVFLLLSFIFFGLSVISYQSAKITTPLIIIGLVFLESSIFKKYWKRVTFLSVICVFMPLVIYFLVRPLRESRFAGISVFTEWKSTIPLGTTLISPSNIFTLTKKITVNYFSHFNPYILFFDSSKLRYFQIENVGMFYSWQLGGILSGLLYIFFNFRKKAYRFLLWLILISPIPASLTTGVPYANIGRNLLMFPVLEIVCALGVITAFQILNTVVNRKIIWILISIFSFVVGTQLYSFSHYYFIEMPKKFAVFWGQPLKVIMPYVISQEPYVKNIIITDTFKQTYMYLLLYGKKEPQWLNYQIKQRHPAVGYSSIGKYEFRAIDWEHDKKLTNTLFIGTPQEIPFTTDSMYEVKQTTGNVLLRVVKTL